MGEVDSEKITIAKAIDHFQREARSAEVWLERFRDGKRHERRPDHNVEEFEQKLRMRRWVVEQLQASQQRGK